MKVKTKSIIAVLSVMALLANFFCLITLPVAADTAETVQYQKVDSRQFLQMFTEKQVPQCDQQLLEAEPSGYLFGGWYGCQENDTVGAPVIDIKNTEAMEYVYAKFVPARLTGVACQVSVDAEKNATGDLRIVSAVDSTNYLAVGFNVYGRQYTQDGTIDWTMYEYDPAGINKAQSTCVYSSLQTYCYDSDGVTVIPGAEKTPADIFGEDASGYKFTTMNLSVIPQSYYDTVIVVQPYWITLDGTYVPGNAEYNRVNDSPNITATDDIVNITVNLQDAADIAAGMLSVTYPQGYTFVNAEHGKVFEQMNFQNNAAGRTVSCIGNVTTNANSENPEEVFVNIRFKKTAAVNAGSVVFTVKIPANAFCSIDEAYPTVTAWDIVQ